MTRCPGEPRQLRLELEPETLFHVKQRIRAEREIGNIGHSFAIIGTAIASLAAAGETTPTEAQIGELSGYSTRTVRRAKVRLRELGILVSRRRGRRVNGVWRRISCEYQLVLPLGPVLLNLPPPLHLVADDAGRPKGQDGRTRQESKKVSGLGTKRPVAHVAHADQARMALAEIARQRQEARNSEWMRRYRGPPHRAAVA